MSLASKQLIDAGVMAGLIRPERMPEYELTARRHRCDVVDVITQLEGFPRVALLRAYAQQSQVPFILPDDYPVDVEALKALPKSLSRRDVIVLRNGEKRLYALGDPQDVSIIQTLQRHDPQAFAKGESQGSVQGLGQELGQGLVMADAAAIQMLRAQHLKGPEAAAESTLDAVQLLDELLQEACLNKASDIHLESRAQGMRVRIRVDGVLQSYSRLFTPAEADAVLTRLKVLSGIDISEKRRPQDGSCEHQLTGIRERQLDIRVATIPTRDGERATLRLLGQQQNLTQLSDLGMSSWMLEQFRQGITKPHGLILVTGPTGSGKSTTLYSALRELNTQVLNVMTVEDPVEQFLDQISQVQVSGQMDFASVLRSFLRHDPDVLLVGEIRDYETADTALKAAQTGHLVLSTLHTNDAVGAIARLNDMGCEPYRIASSLLGVVAQRLVRRLCAHCRQAKAEATPEAIEYSAKGCPHCLGTGYRGRVGVFESLWLDEQMNDDLLQGKIPTHAQIHHQAERYQHCYRSMAQDALEKVHAGQTSRAELHKIGLNMKAVAPPTTAV